MIDHRVLSIELPVPTAGSGVVTVLPGQGYSAQGAVLDFPATALAEAGWRLRVVEWAGVCRDVEHIRAVYDEVVRTSVAESRDARHLVLAKSVGSLALPTAVDLDIAGVWLTPLIAANDRVRSALERVEDVAQPHMLIGGTADKTWDSGVAATSAAVVVELAEANHGLEVGGWRNNLNQVELITAEVERFAAQLPR